MIDARTEELINAALDDEISTAEREELKQRLARNPQAREYREHLQALHDGLSRLAPEDLPADLHPQIASSVELPVTPLHPPVAEQANGRRALAGYGLAAALALAIGAVLFARQPWTPEQAAYPQMSGTIAPAEQTTRAPTDTFSIEQGSFKSRASLSRGVDQTILVIDVDSNDSVDLLIDITGTGLSIARIEPTPSDPDTLSVADNTVRLRGHGERHYSVVFDRTAAAPPNAQARINVAYKRNDAVIAQRALHVN